jgi:hypothetical protein
MKKVLLILVFISILGKIGTTQELPMDSTTGKYTFQGVVKVDSTSKNELYSRAREWFAKTFNSANNVIQMDDKEAGKIIGKGCFKVRCGKWDWDDRKIERGVINFTLSIYIKDGKFKYVITDFSHEDGQVISSGRSSTKLLGGGALEVEKNFKNFWGGLNLKILRTLKVQTNEQMNALAENLVKTLTTKKTNNVEEF